MFTFVYFNITKRGIISDGQTLMGISWSYFCHYKMSHVLVFTRQINVLLLLRRKVKHELKLKSRMMYTLTEYITSVHPSSVTHWKTVNIARPKLSKLVMPSFGPSQPSRHSIPGGSTPGSVSLSTSASHMTPFPHGCTGSTISPTTYSRNRASLLITKFYQMHANLYVFFSVE